MSTVEPATSVATVTDTSQGHASVLTPDEVQEQNAVMLAYVPAGWGSMTAEPQDDGQQHD